MDNYKEGACWVFLLACSLRFPCHFLINDWGIYIPNWSIYGQQPSVIKTFFPVAPLVVFVFGSSCWHEAMVGRTPAWHNGVTPYYANFSLALYCWKIYCILVILTLALALTFPIWITVNYLGDPDNNVIFASYIGSFFLAGAYLSVTSMTSAFTRNQVISFILSVVICLFLVLCGFPPVTDVVETVAPRWIVNLLAFSVMPNIEQFNNGQIDSRSVIYFLSVIGFPFSLLA